MDAVFDFSPLSRQVTLPEVRRALMGYSQRWRIGIFILGVMAFLPSVLLVLLTVLGTLAGGGALFLAVMLVGSAYGFWTIYSAVVVSLRIRDFAARNSLAYIHDSVGPGYAGTYFSQRQVRILDAIRSNAPLFIELGNFQELIDGRQHHYGYVRIKLPKALPHIMLNAKSNGRDLPDDVQHSQILHLEGDFDQHFTLYAPQGFERDALYIFTPDVMARFIDTVGAFNCEIIDDELYLYGNQSFNLTQPTVITGLDALAAQLLEKFGRQIRNYSDDRAAASSVAANAQPSAVSAPGRRLKRLPWPAAVLLYSSSLVALIAIAIFMINQSKHQPDMAVFWRTFASLDVAVLCAGLIGAAGILAQHRQKS
ncbi:MAG TPA: hypothetical protein VN031_00830 [Candidatus Microsaccharimonas sp.]|nr:hypothetical protein [Candidatus Microsaccharimonas sp.]